MVIYPTNHKNIRSVIRKVGLPIHDLNNSYDQCFLTTKLMLNFAGYQIKKGWSVNLDVVSIHHDPNVFPDPEKFNPSRFDVSLSSCHITPNQY